jgi:hypothetical protein
MKNLDTFVTLGGIVYGLVLILGTFVRSKATESLRVDALLIRQPTDSTRPLNLIIGILVAGYGVYSWFAR